MSSSLLLVQIDCFSSTRGTSLGYARGAGNSTFIGLEGFALTVLPCWQLSQYRSGEMTITMPTLRSELVLHSDFIVKN
jgi:hypothetical protein